jgi:glycosyltransferase involved in cell wall biosynthesis
MRIAFISGLAGYDWGGSEALWSQTAHRFIERGDEVFVSVVGRTETPAPIAALRAAGALVDERRWETPGIRHRIFPRLLHRLLVSLDCEPSWKRIRKFNADLVCVSHGGTACGLVWMEKCLREDVPFVTVAQAVGDAYWPDDRGADRLIRAYSGARAAFFVSEGNLRLFERQLATSLPNADTVQNPFYVPWDVKVPWPPEEPCWKFASVARLEPAAKGQDLLFEVLASEKWRARNWHLNLYGSGHGERLLRRLSEKLDLDDRVTFHGHVPDVAGIWARNHILLLASRFEGLPLALVEAMLCSRTAVVTDVAGNPEVVQDGVTGFLAAAPAISLVDAALERAWSRRSEWHRMGAAAADSIRQIRFQDPVEEFANRLQQIILSGRHLSKNQPPLCNNGTPVARATTCLKSR